MTAGGVGVEGLSKNEKGLMGVGSGVVIAGGGVYTRVKW